MRVDTIDDRMAGAEALARAEKTRAWRKAQFRQPPPVKVVPAPLPDPRTIPGLCYVRRVPKDSILEVPPPSIRLVAQCVAEHFNVALTEIASIGRTRDVVLPRHITMYLAKGMTLKSLAYIGRSLGDRDHATVGHAVKRIERLLASDAAFAGLIETLRSRILAAAALLPAVEFVAPDRPGVHGHSVASIKRGVCSALGLSDFTPSDCSSNLMKAARVMSMALARHLTGKSSRRVGELHFRKMRSAQRAGLIYRSAIGVIVLPKGAPVEAWVKALLPTAIEIAERRRRLNAKHKERLNWYNAAKWSEAA